MQVYTGNCRLWHLPNSCKSCGHVKSKSTPPGLDSYFHRYEYLSWAMFSLKRFEMWLLSKVKADADPIFQRLEDSHTLVHLQSCM